MPLKQPATYLALDASWRVIGSAMRLQQAEAIAPDARVVDLYRADLASLALIAERDDPRLAARGTGILGAGTHPAAPYLEALRAMAGIDRSSDLRSVQFGYDNAHDIVLRFLDNASTWRGDTARAVKAELRGRL